MRTNLCASICASPCEFPIKTANFHRFESCRSDHFLPSVLFTFEHSNALDFSLQPLAIISLRGQKESAGHRGLPLLKKHSCFKTFVNQHVHLVWQGKLTVGITVAKGRDADSNQAKRELGFVRKLRQKAVCACRAGWFGQSG